MSCSLKGQRRTTNDQRTACYVLRSSLVIGRSSALPERRGVDQATFGPQRVLPARQVELCIGAEMAIIDLAVIADGPDDFHHEVVVEAQTRAQIAFEPEQTAHVRV